jgi:hypothetical protein
MDYGLIDAVVAGELPNPKPLDSRDTAEASPVDSPEPEPLEQEAAKER